MFYYIKGELVLTEPAAAVIDCGGVGYKLTISKNTLSRLSRLGETAVSYTHLRAHET